MDKVLPSSAKGRLGAKSSNAMASGISIGMSKSWFTSCWVACRLFVSSGYGGAIALVLMFYFRNILNYTHLLIASGPELVLDTHENELCQVLVLEPPHRLFDAE
jgi:hypothetical protein